MSQVEFLNKKRVSAGVRSRTFRFPVRPRELETEIDETRVERSTTSDQMSAGGPETSTDAFTKTLSWSIATVAPNYKAETHHHSNDTEYEPLADIRGNKRK